MELLISKSCKLFLLFILATSLALANDASLDFKNRDGAVEAKALISQGKIQFLLPSSPPARCPTDIRHNEYLSFGIEIFLTGDVYRSDFEKYRNDFNQVMKDHVVSKYGSNFF